MRFASRTRRPRGGAGLVWILGSSLVSLAACGESPASDGGAESETVAPEDGTNDDTDTETGDETGDETSGETSGDVCDPAVDEAVGTGDITITLSNASAAPIWLRGHDCLSFARFEFEVDGDLGTDWPNEGEACGLILQTPACGTFGCEGDGMEGGAVRIGPGETWQAVVDRYYFPMVEFPGSCHPEADCAEPISCRAGRQIAPDLMLTARVTAYRDCSDDVLATGCACTDGETCTLEQGVYSFAEPIDGEASVASLAASSSLSIEFM